MGVIDAPQWLLPAFARSLKTLGATASAEQIRSRGELLVERWSAPERRFHNLRHLIDMLARVDELADESHSPDVMRVATWYHGCVFSAEADKAGQGRSGEDEEASAALAASDLRDLEVPEAVVSRVCSLILHLRHHALAADDMDAMALGDADLGTLAVDPQTYKEYLRLLREEYAHVPLAAYLTTRLTVVEHLLERERLFRSPLGERWEVPARQNLEAEMQRLRERLDRLTPDEAEQCSRVREPSAAAGAGQDQPPWHVQERSASSLVEEPDDDHLRRGRSSHATSLPPGPQGATEEALRPATARAPSSATPSAPSPRTPGRGVPRPPRPSAGRSADRSTPEHSGSARSEAAKGDLALGTSMESCAADLDQLMASPRSHLPGETEDTSGMDRSARAEAERARLAERLLAKTYEARELREARVGGLTPAAEETADNGASGR